MNKPRITLLESLESNLIDYLTGHPDGHERAAIIFFRRLSRPVKNLPNSDRYISVDTIPFDEKWINSSSASHIDFDLEHLREVFRRCEEEDLVFGFVHNHPTGYAGFSDTDDCNEFNLIQAISNRNGLDSKLVALLWDGKQWHARVRNAQSPHDSIPVRHTLVVGKHIKIYGYQIEEIDDKHASARQAAAFGKPFVGMLKSLRVIVIGASGTGSPTTTLLARSSVGEIITVDNDKFDPTNINRVRGSKTRDKGRNKAEMLAEFIKDIDLPSVEIVAIDALIDKSPEAVDALASADIVFGCTDDQIGRELLLNAVYYYAQPLIDVGLGGDLDEDKDGNPYLRYHFGRVSTILPEYGECLFCQDVINETWIRTEFELRSNPNMSDEEIKAKYLQKSGENAPGVGPFTSATADYGVAGFYNLIRPYRVLPEELRNDQILIDFVYMSLSSREQKNNKECPYCGTHSLLVKKEKYRLNRPSLGKPNDNN
ncbi:Sulfur carrier protein adenylyltransferase ThiF [hydrothermal vent metagenome]|uniref:Sulfur carrier protein adenylyltransferase ThiF n=1 Tax=hydrothermal vent metagenome TaxID=652676 RepID=A0A3B0YJT7_9ZZZZ